MAERSDRERRRERKIMTMRERILQGTHITCKVIRIINERDMKYYYKDREIDPADLLEEKKLRGK